MRLLARQSSPASNPQQPSTTAATPALTVQSRKVTAYTLPPDLYRKARNLSKIRFRLALIGFVYGLIVLWLILHWKLAPRYRDWAEGFSRRRFLQSIVFAPLLLLTIAILTFPLDIYGEWVEKDYGISVQSWPPWGWDWMKGEPYHAGDWNYSHLAVVYRDPAQSAALVVLFLADLAAHWCVFILHRTMGD